MSRVPAQESNNEPAYSYCGFSFDPSVGDLTKLTPFHFQK